MAAEETAYFVRWRGKMTGPFTMGQLKLRAAEGQLAPLHEVSTDQVTWCQAGTLSDLWPPREMETLQREEDDSSSQEGGPPSELSLPQWYYSVGGQVEGPCSGSAIRKMIAEGKVSRSDYVSPAERPEDWRLILETPEFKDQTSLADKRPAEKDPRSAALFPMSELKLDKDPAAAHGAGYKMAKASMTLGFVGMVLLPLGAVALILGVVAKIKLFLQEDSAGSGMATTGIILGVLEIAAIVAVWIAVKKAGLWPLPLG